MREDFAGAQRKSQVLKGPNLAATPSRNSSGLSHGDENVAQKNAAMQEHGRELNLVRFTNGRYLAATTRPGAARKLRIGLLVDVSQIFTSPSNPPVASRLVPGCTVKQNT